MAMVNDELLSSAKRGHFNVRALSDQISHMSAGDFPGEIVAQFGNDGYCFGKCWLGQPGTGMECS